jgi:hypothetical protein
MMIRTRHLRNGFLLCGCLLQAQTRPAAEALTAHLKNFSILHVDFTQNRTLAALSRPLKSSGSMTLSRDKGVLWQIRKPLTLGFLITPKGLKEVGADGQVRARDAKDAPVVAQMGRILQSLLQGKWSALDDYFTIRAEGSPGRWKISLAPRPQTASFIKAVQVSGGPFIERVRVEEAGGDAMEILFERPRTADPLTEAEARLFAGE